MYNIYIYKYKSCFMKTFYLIKIEGFYKKFQLYLKFYMQ